MSEAEASLPEPRTRLAAYALCADGEDRILLCRIAPGYPAVGMWTLPGGGVKFGEHPEDATLRELTQETGLQGTIERLLFVHSTSGLPRPGFGDQPWHGVRVVYQVSIVGGELRDEADESTDRAAWFPLVDARELPIVDLVQVALSHVASK